MKQNSPTVFTNAEIGISMQKVWMKENIDILSKTYFEEKSDFILAVPHNKSGQQVRTMFMKLNELNKNNGFDDGLVNRISNYVLKMKSENKVVVIFMNYEGRISYYAIIAKNLNTAA